MIDIMPYVKLLKELNGSESFPRELSRLIALHEGNVIDKLQIMEKAGLVERGKRGQKQIYLITNKGKEFYNKFEMLLEKLPKCIEELGFEPNPRK